jgi:hypothetical protein
VRKANSQDFYYVLIVIKKEKQGSETNIFHWRQAPSELGCTALSVVYPAL